MNHKLQTKTKPQLTKIEIFSEVKSISSDNKYSGEEGKPKETQTNEKRKTRDTVLMISVNNL